MQLLKACMIQDIERMEAGIYEVVPQDFALVDYASTSKSKNLKSVNDKRRRIKSSI